MTSVWATDHAGLSVLTMDDCAALLRANQVGRIAFLSDGEIEVFPVNYTVDGNMVAFRTIVGSKLTAALENVTVAFEIDGFDVGRQLGWSVVVKGTCEEVRADATLSRLEATRLRTWLDAPGPLRWIQVRAHSVTGRQIPEATALSET
jgi:nitroimidazol reductase NimA-like FMN-containing flavoprotein (pyridoxamine 5'-phosphate oxidase superfamily)